MARRYWPGEDPVGRRFNIGAGPWIEIVGVSGDVKHGSLREPPAPEFYLPFQQSPWSFMTIVIESPLTADALGAAIERDLAAIDPSLARAAGTTDDDAVEELGVARSVRDGRAGRVRGHRSRAGDGRPLRGDVVSGRAPHPRAGAAARAGARPSQILTSVVMDGLRLAGLGLIAGLGLSLIVSRALQGALFGVSPTDPITLIAVASILAIVAAVASVVPARRAMRVDPIVALRME